MQGPRRHGKPGLGLILLGIWLGVTIEGLGDGEYFLAGYGALGTLCMLLAVFETTRECRASAKCPNCDEPGKVLPWSF